ncbi:MAG: hypothetical protein Q9183_007766, partial [Haloplaca sp. 2 TL-2023]
MPRQHRRRREKKLMTMEEVNDRFPLMKYKQWMTTRAEEGLPTAGGIAGPHTDTASLRNLGGGKSSELDRSDTLDKERPMTPHSSTPQQKHETETTPPENSTSKEDHSTIKDAGSSSTDSADRTNATTSQPSATAGSSADTPATAPTRQEVQNDDDMDDDDQIQIAVPSEMLANPGDSCAICIDTLEDDEDVRGLTCGHAFHASCLDPWLTSRRACCPLCKADYYVPKPRPEGEAAAEADRLAGRRPPGMTGARIDPTRSTHYGFMSRADGRPRMILPGRFLAMGRFDQRESQRF